MPKYATFHKIYFCNPEKALYLLFISKLLLLLEHKESAEYVFFYDLRNKSFRC